MKISLSKNLDGPRNEALAQIDADALRALQSYRTSSDYAVAVYALKRAELSAYDSGQKSVDELSMLTAEAAAIGERPDVLLATWRRKISDEDAAILEIEARRQVARQKVKSARSPAEIKAILELTEWPH